MNNDDVLTLPISGGMRSRHSKKLEFAIRDFITENGGSYYDDELYKGVLTSYFKLSEDMSVEQKIKIREDDVVCYTTLSVFVNMENKNLVNDVMRKLNLINLEITYGNFEMSENGDIRFRSYYSPNDKIYLEDIDMLLGYPKHIIKEYESVLVN